MTDTPLEDIDNPWVWEARDYQENAIRITINWDSSDGNLMSAIVYRDPACVYTKIFIGLSDTDGTVNNSPDQWTIPAGETLIRHNVLRKARLRSIHDVLHNQITAGE